MPPDIHVSSVTQRQPLVFDPNDTPHHNTQSYVHTVNTHNNINSVKNMNHISDRVIVNKNVNSIKNTDCDLDVNTVNIYHNSSVNVNYHPLPDSAVTPINISNFKNCLNNHPDLVSYLVNGLSNGFDIGFNAPLTATRPNNLLSATENQTAVSTALMKEVSRGHTAGPFNTLTPPWTELHCSPLGSREKKDGTRRLIMDLSQPKGMSINEGIDKEEYSVQYTHFDEATKLVRAEGRNSLMSKVDIQHAFRLLPVLPCQWILLGILWLGQYFIDTRLPFGLRSSPGIFNRFADAVCWIIQHIFNIRNIVHYSNDFFLVSSNNISHAQSDLLTVKSAFTHLNVPIAENKLEGPHTNITCPGYTNRLHRSHHPHTRGQISRTLHHTARMVTSEKMHKKGNTVAYRETLIRLQGHKAWTYVSSQANISLNNCKTTPPPHINQQQCTR